MAPRAVAVVGATGAVELIVCVKAINESTIPPTINLEHQDERCDLKMVGRLIE